MSIVLILACSTPQVLAEDLLKSPEIAPKISLGHRLRTNLSSMSNAVGLELSKLTLGLLSMQFDMHQKHARVSLGGGDPGAFRLHFDSDVLVKGSQARVQARIDLAIAGSSYELELPEFNMSTESVAGERAVQLSLPLIKSRF